MLKDYLPAIASVIVAILTVATNLWLGVARQKLDNTSVKHNEDGSLRDDLLELNERYETRVKSLEDQLSKRDERYESKIQLLEQQITVKDQVIERKNDQLEQYQKQIVDQYSKIADLNITVKQLKNDIEELRKELQKFERKVFYRSEETPQ